MTEKRAALLVVAAVAAFIAAATAFTASGRSDVVKAMNDQIEREDSALCAKFGFAATDKFAGCLADLADLRKRHSDMLASYSWP